MPAESRFTVLIVLLGLVASTAGETLAQSDRSSREQNSSEAEVLVYSATPGAY